MLIKYYRILKEHCSVSLAKLVMLGLVTGLSSTALLILINHVIALDPSNKHFYGDLFVGFVAVLGLQYVTQAIYQTKLVNLVQELIWSVRIKTMRNVLNAKFLEFSQYGSARVYNILTTDAGNIGHVGNIIASVTVSSVIIISSLIYLAILNPTGFVISISCMMLVILIFKMREKIIIKKIVTARKLEDDFLEYIQNVVFGIKELKVNKAKSHHLFEQAKEAARVTKDLRASSTAEMMNNSLLGSLSFFLFIGTILFIFPLFQLNIFEQSAPYILVILFILRPSQEIATALPFFYNASVGIDNFNELQDLKDLDESPSFVNEPLTFTKELSLNKIIFRYPDNTGEKGFNLGPIDLRIFPKEILFFTGGNGSGKSTFVNLITGLYEPLGGEIIVDGVSLSKLNFESYRNLFSPVFTDSYLFRKLHSFTKDSDSKMNEILAELGLTHKVTFEDASFSTVNLSYGQVKRLCLASALVEGRGIYVLDEVCANQDKEFKEYFYNCLLPRLKRGGNTLLVITHDEIYNHVADRHYHFENGLMKQISIAASV